MNIIPISLNEKCIYIPGVLLVLYSTVDTKEAMLIKLFMESNSAECKREMTEIQAGNRSAPLPHYKVAVIKLVLNSRS